MPRRDDDNEILDIIPERFDPHADSRKGGGGSRGLLTIALAIVAVVAAFLTARAIFFDGGSGSQVAETAATDNSVPVVKADQRPVKTRPDDRGGMAVPNQDKLVYERLGPSGAAEPGVERLLPPPETPQAPPAPPEKPAVPPTAATAGGSLPPPPAAPAAPPPAYEPPPPAAAPPVPPVAPAQTAQVPPPPAAPAPAKLAPAPAPAAPAPAQVAAVPPPSAAAVKPAAGGGFVAQLGALRSPEDADKEWKKIQAANRDVMGGLSSDVVKVEIPGKGTFWRLRAGPLDEAGAKTLCDDLKKRNQGCIVARK